MAVVVSWWVVALTLVGGTVFPFMCYCPGQYYFAGTIALVPLILGVRMHRWAASIALAVSIFGAIHELNGQRRDHQMILELRRRASEQGQSSAVNPK